jgi:hypothetical protein
MWDDALRAARRHLFRTLNTNYLLIRFIVLTPLPSYTNTESFRKPSSRDVLQRHKRQCPHLRPSLDSDDSGADKTSMMVHTIDDV